MFKELHRGSSSIHAFNDHYESPWSCSRSRKGRCDGYSTEKLCFEAKISVLKCIEAKPWNTGIWCIGGKKMLLRVKKSSSRRGRGSVSSVFIIKTGSLDRPALYLGNSQANSVCRLQQAAADPSALTQETIIDNLDQVEKGRLARIRNIGIAVCTGISG